MRGFWTLVALAVVLTAGCGGDPIAPPVVDVSMTLTQAASEPGEILLEVTVLNRGTADVHHYAGCTQVVAFEFSDANGAPVVLHDPCGPVPLCPESIVRLQPGRALTEVFPVRGVRWGPATPPSCEEVPLEPGVYTARVRFLYWGPGAEDQGSPRTVTRSLDFTWNPPG